MPQKIFISEFSKCLTSSFRYILNRKNTLLPIFLLLFIFLQNKITIAQDIDSLSPEALKKLTLEELMNIEIEVTSVSKRPQKLTEAASAIQVITQEDIRRSGATSLPEALRLASNLQVAQVNSSQWAISARGFNNVLANKLLVMIDGRSVYTPLYAGVFWDVQNVALEDVDRIEVISGPGGTLWGANAVNGVINIITKKAKDTPGLFAEIATGTKLKLSGNLRYGGKLSDNLHYRVYGMGYKRDHTILNDGSDAKDDWAMGQGGFRLDWTPTEKDLITLQGDIYDTTPNPDGAEYVIARGGNILSRWSHTSSERSDFQLQLYYDHTWRDFRNGFAEKLHTYDFDWQHRFQIAKRHNIVWGTGFRLMNHKVTNLELFAFLPGDKILNLYSAFVQDEITLIRKRLKLTIGSKFEHHTYTGLQYQPSGRIAWTPGDRQTLWAAVSRGLRNPSRIDREFFLYLAPGVPFISGNDNFKPEDLLAYELGWRLNPNEKLSFSVATFYNVYDNIRSAEPGPAPFNIPVTFGNGVKGYTYGTEFYTIYQINEWWHLRGGYTFLQKNLSVKSNSNDSNEGTAESNDPKHQFLFQSSVNLRNNIAFGTVLRYIGELPDPEIPGYLGIDVRLSYTIKNLIELSIIGQNLVDERHTEFIPESPSPRKIERSVYGKITCRF